MSTPFAKARIAVLSLTLVNFAAAAESSDMSVAEQPLYTVGDALADAIAKQFPDKF